MGSSHPTKSLEWLFEPFIAGKKAHVLHLGHPLPNTVKTFTNYRCNIHVADVFPKLSLPIFDEEKSGDYFQFFYDTLDVNKTSSFNLCLFWDFFNFLDDTSLAAFADFLSPFLQEDCRAHAFAVHNTKSIPSQYVYGINDLQSISFRSREEPIRSQTPPTLRMLEEQLSCFSFEKKIILPDNRIELAMLKKP